MVFKKKHFTVIFFSSLIISVIIISTLGVYTVYIRWKEDTSKTFYRNSIYSITADIFRDKLEIHNIKTSVYQEDYSTKIPVIEGKIKNNSKKIITSMFLEISFSKPDGTVIYRDWFSPTDDETLLKSPFFSSAKYSRLSLKPDETLSFRYFLRNSPDEIKYQLFTKGTFAKASGYDEIKLYVKISGLSVI